MKNNSRLLALASISLSVALVLGAFAVVWLTPREAAPAQAQNTPDKATQITVRGSGGIAATPDILVMNVGVSIQDVNVKDAQSKVSTAMNGMMDKLKAAGVEAKDYRTLQYTVEPVMDHNNDAKGQPQQPKLTGFRVTNVLEIIVRKPETAPQLLDDLVSAGANTVWNVSYTFSDLPALTRQAYDKAVNDAQERAERLASLSGMQLGKIVSISDASASTIQPAYKDGMGGGASGPMAPGQQTVFIDVIVTYEATAKK